MNLPNKKIENSKKVLIKLKIKEIFPLKEDIKNLLAECTLKFNDTNNNKYNIYNLSYMLNNAIILIPTYTSKIDKLEIYLIINNTNLISKGILYLDKNTDEQIIKFGILDNYINIKFTYKLNFINNNNENKIKRRISFKKSKATNRSSIKYYSNELNNNKKSINIKQKIKIKFKSKKNSNDSELSQSDRKNSIHFNVNKSQIIFPYNLIINNNKEFNENSNKNNYSEIWINDTKMFIKRIRNYITLRNSRNNSRKDFKKCLSAKNIYSYMDCSNKYTNSKTKKKRNMKNINTNSSNSSSDTQRNLYKFNTNEISNTKKYSTGKKLNRSATSDKENSHSKKDSNRKFKNLTIIPRKNNNINYSITNEIKNQLFKNYIEPIYAESNNKSQKNLIVENNNNFNIQDKVNSINKKYSNENNNINNNLYKKKKISDIYSKKINFFPIKLTDINPINKIINENQNKNIIQDNISAQESSKINKKENSNYSTFNDFYTLKNDLYSVYNNQYINNIKNELLKLEFELFIEKTIELMNEYHKNIDAEKNIYKFLMDSCENYKYLNSIYKKKNKKLDKIKEINKEKIDKLNIKNKDLLIYKNEISLFESLFKNDINKKENKNYFNKNKSKNISKILKNILIKILNNKSNKELMKQFEKYNNWINNNIIKNKCV